MSLERKGVIKFNKYTVGLALVCLYIFTSYIAQDVLISSSINSVCLYAFLLFSAYLFVVEFRRQGTLSIFSVWFIVFMLASLVIFLYSPSMSQTFDSFYAMIVTFFVFLFLQIYARKEHRFHSICWCYAISAFVLVLLLLVTGNLSGDAEDRLGHELMGNANIFATMMMVATMYTMWLLIFQAKTRRAKFLLLIMIVMDIYALILSAGRKFFIIPFVFLYILLLNKTDKRGRKHVIAYTILFVIGMIALWYLIMNMDVLYRSIGIRMEGLIESLLGEEGDSSSEIREIIRNLAFDEWLKRPLWGYGFDSFKFLAKKAVGHFYYSHCNYTELLYCGGIVYFLIYYWIFYKIIRICWKNKSLPTQYKAFALAATISQFIFDYGAVTYNSTPALIMLMMAFTASTFTTTTLDGGVSDGKNKDLDPSVEK